MALHRWRIAGGKRGVAARVGLWRWVRQHARSLPVSCTHKLSHSQSQSQSQAVTLAIENKGVFGRRNSYKPEATGSGSQGKGGGRGRGEGGAPEECLKSVSRGAAALLCCHVGNPVVQ